MLRPVTRLLIGRVRLPELVALVEHVFVDEAKESLRQDGRAQSPAAVSIASGVSTAELKRTQATARPPRPETTPSILLLMDC
jgi:hypothetical protein